MKPIRSARDWLEVKITYPGTPLDSALVIEGPKESGKSVAAKLISQRLPYSTFSKIKPIKEYYGALMEQADVIIFDEWDELKDIELLYHFMGSQRITVHPKADESYTIRNRTGFIFLTKDAKLFTDIDGDRFIPVTPMEVFAILSDINIR